MADVHHKSKHTCNSRQKAWFSARKKLRQAPRWLRLETRHCSDLLPLEARSDWRVWVDGRGTDVCADQSWNQVEIRSIQHLDSSFFHFRNKRYCKKHSVCALLFAYIQPKVHIGEMRGLLPQLLWLLAIVVIHFIASAAAGVLFHSLSLK